MSYPLSALDKSGIPFPFRVGEEDIQRIKINVRAPLIALTGVICVATLFLASVSFSRLAVESEIYSISWQSHRVCFSLGYSMSDSQIVLW